MLAFDPVRVGERETLPLRIRNEGGTPLRVRPREETSAPFSINQGEIVLSAGEQATIEVAFAPEATGRFEAILELQTNVGINTYERLLVQGEGVEAPGPLSVDPPGCLHFGGQAIHTGARCALTLRNDGAAPLEIESLQLDGEDPIFRLIPPLLAPPWTLAPEEEREVEIEYRPRSLGTHEGTLVIRSGDPLRPESRVCLQELQTDSFALVSAPRVDVLWVLDNSSAMTNYHAAVRRAFPALLGRAVELGIDFHLGVTTSGLKTSGSCPGGANGGENGRLFPVDGSAPRILHPGMRWEELQEAWNNNTDVGHCQSEAPMNEAAKRALSPPVINNAKVPGSYVNDGNLGFLRHDAALSIVFVTDDGDPMSPLPVGEYLGFFRSLKPSSRVGDVRVHAISAGRTKGGCSAIPCPRCVDGAEQSGGMWVDICTPGLAGSETIHPAFEQLSDALFAFETTLALRGRPADRNDDAKVDHKDLEVRVGGEVVSARSGARTVWRFDRTRNAVFFAPDHRPAVGEPITVHYRKSCL